MSECRCFHTNMNTFLISNAFFNSASVLLNSSMNWASNIALVLLNTCSHNYTWKSFIFSIISPCLGLGLFMPHPCDLFFIFSLIFVVTNHITPFKQTYLFFVDFLEYLLLCLDDNVEKANEWRKRKTFK